MNVDFVFGGAPYTPPALDAVNFVFPDAGFVPRATGFTSTHFGTPETDLVVAGIGAAPSFGTPYAKQQLRAEGFAAQVHFGHVLGPGYFRPESAPPATTFGAPIGPNNVFALGFSPATFGSPVGPNNAFATPVIPGSAFGIAGIPLRPQPWAASRFGSAKAVYRQVAVASGWASAAVSGGALGSTFIIHQHGQTAQCHGWSEAGFGMPAASWAQECEAVSSVGTAFGQPQSSHGGGASGFAPMVMGTPSSSFVAKAEHFIPVRFGAASSATVHMASGRAPRTHFGLPVSVRPCSHVAYGAHVPARFGAARVTRPVALAVRGLCIGGRFGQPRAGCHI